MKNVVADIESDNLLDDLTKIHCLVIQDLESDEVLSCTDSSPDYPSIREGLELLSQADRIYGHNWIRFDHPALLKLYPEFKTDARIIDTLVATRLRFAHIKRSDFARAKMSKLPSRLIGSQGLEAWGHRLGENKEDYTGWCKRNGIEEPWAHWSKAMQDYCAQDVKVNKALVLKLREVGVPSEALDADLELAWYLAQQERNGWPVNEEHLSDYIAKLADRKLELEEVLIEHFGSWLEFDREFTPKVSNSRYGYVEGATVSKINWTTFNPNSTQQIADRLQTLYGWKPTQFTPTGLPQITEDVLEGLDLPMAEELKEYLMVKQRVGQVTDGKQAWVKHLDGKAYQGGALTGMRHIHHSIGAVTVTHRHRHSHPNLGQVPKIGTPYGEESRGTFVSPPGWKCVGADASGLELRCLAHYMAKYDDGAYGRAILEGDKADGSDVHSMNAKALDLTRNDAKTWIYAWLYGAGNEKLGKTAGVTEEEIANFKLQNRKWQRELAWRKKAGRDTDDRAIAHSLKGAEQKAKFLERTPALKYLKEAVDKATEQRGYVLLPDGRRAYIRHKHAALNTLLQGAGSIIVKHWIIEANRELVHFFGSRAGGGWDQQWAAMGWIHDEMQLASTEFYAPKVAEILEQTIAPVGEKFDWRLPLEAQADIGDSWAETH